ncbi:MAG: 50S ribosomal protein L19 [Bacillota bacterium]
MDVLKIIDNDQKKKEIPSFNIGDTVRVHVKVIEGTRERIQIFEGIVMKKQGTGVRETFTVRRISYGVAVERTFPINSPKLEKIDVIRKGKVRRAKLYYLRGRVGKKAKIKEKR